MKLAWATSFEQKIFVLRCPPIDCHWGLSYLRGVLRQRLLSECPELRTVAEACILLSSVRHELVMSLTPEGYYPGQGSSPRLLTKYSSN